MGLHRTAAPPEAPPAPELPEDPAMPALPETPPSPELPEAPPSPELPETAPAPASPEAPPSPELPETPLAPAMPALPAVAGAPLAPALETPLLPPLPEDPAPEPAFGALPAALPATGGRGSSNGVDSVPQPPKRSAPTAQSCVNVASLQKGTLPIVDLVLGRLVRGSATPRMLKEGKFDHLELRGARTQQQGQARPRAGLA
jgi:hypothetical protein